MLYSVRPEVMEADYPQSAGVPSNPLVGGWAYLGCLVPSDLMHPKDAARYLAGPLGETLYQCVRLEDGFAVVRNAQGHEYRANPARVIWITPPRFKIGDPVRTTVGTPRIGWVRCRGWHRKDSRVYLLIDIPTAAGRKRHKRRYWEDELEPSLTRVPG